jgi:uncharacterized protein YsxB (DUF464 family)
MTRIEFKKHKECILGFDVSGHTGYAQEGEDIACAAVSSAVMMAVNGITDVIGADAQILVDDEEAHIALMLNRKDAQSISCGVMMLALHNHIVFLQEEFPLQFEIVYTEV